MIGRVAACRVAALIVLSWTVPNTRAETPRPAPSGAKHSSVAGKRGRLVFAREGSLMQVELSGRGLRRIATLPQPRTIAKLAASSSGVVVVRDDLGSWYWVDRWQRRPSFAPLPCTVDVTLAPSGRIVVCSGSPRAVQIHEPATGAVKMIPGNVLQPNFRDHHERELVAASDGKLWAISLADWSARRLLVPHAPTGGLLVAPDGSRAVGRYPDDGHQRVFSFRIDGKGARRRLMRDARPVAWSADSKWLLIEAKNMACIVRAVGGQFKCWRGYRAVAISGDGRTAIVARADKTSRKRMHLYKASLNGPNVGTPTPLAPNGSAAGAWVAR